MRATGRLIQQQQTTSSWWSNNLTPSYPTTWNTKTTKKTTIQRHKKKRRAKQMQANKGFSKESFSFRLSYISLLKSSTWNKIYVFMTLLRPKGYRFNCPNKENIISVLYIFKRKLLHKHMKDTWCGWNIFQIASLSNMEELWHRMNVWFHNKKEQMIFTEQILG